jgi:hypothetical protein
MANWEAAANAEFAKVKAAFSATDAQMQTLKQQIETWANGHATGSTRFPFGKMRNTGVTVTTNGGWITRIDYGDN